MDDYQAHIACEDSEFLIDYLDYSPDHEVAFEDLPPYLDNSPKTTTAAVTPKRAYKNVCWYCHAPVASDNAATPQCRNASGINVASAAPVSEDVPSQLNSGDILNRLNHH